MKKAVFLDRDGTINKSVFRNGKISCPWFFEELELVEYAKESLQELKDKNYFLVLVTNQPDIARKNLDISELNKINNFIKQELKVDEVLFCPHDNSDNCGCRKPKPGMIFYAATKFDIDISKSFFIGDTLKDMQAAQSAYCKNILIDADFNQQINCYKQVEDLKTAVEFILTQD